MSSCTNCLGEAERLWHIHDTCCVRVGRAIEVELKIPSDEHLIPKEVAVFQTITNLLRKGRIQLVCFTFKEVYSGNCQETDTRMVLACQSLWQPFQNDPSRHLGSGFDALVGRGNDK